MTAIGFTSFTGSPGVTTWSVLLTSAISKTLKADGNLGSADSLLVEADPAGSKTALHYGFSTPSLLSFASSEANKPVWREHALRLPSGENIISAAGSPTENRNLLATAGKRIFSSLSADSRTMAVIDLGRLHSDSPALAAIEELDFLVALVDRLSNSDIVFSSNALTEIATGLAVDLGWAVVGSKGQSDDAIEHHSGVKVVANISDDATGAAALFDRPAKWVLRRSKIAAAAESFAKRLPLPKEAGVT